MIVAMLTRLPGAVRHADAQAHQPLGAHEAAQDHGREQAAVDVAAAQDETDPPAAEALGMAHHGGEAGRTRPLGHGLLDLQQLQDRGLDRGLLDQQHVVDQPLDDRVGEVARLLDRDALGDGRAARERRQPAQAAVDGRVERRLDADDLDPGLAPPWPRWPCRRSGRRRRSAPPAPRGRVPPPASPAPACPGPRSPPRRRTGGRRSGRRARRSPRRAAPPPRRRRPRAAPARRTGACSRPSRTGCGAASRWSPGCPGAARGRRHPAHGCRPTWR